MVAGRFGGAFHDVKAYAALGVRGHVARICRFTEAVDCVSPFLWSGGCFAGEADLTTATDPAQASDDGVSNLEMLDSSGLAVSCLYSDLGHAKTAFS